MTLSTEVRALYSSVSVLKLGSAYLLFQRGWMVGVESTVLTLMVSLSDFIEHLHSCLLEILNLLIKSNDLTEFNSLLIFSNETAYWQ